MSDMSRRGFLFTAAATAVVISLPVLQAEADDAPAKKRVPQDQEPVDAGELSSFSKDGITTTWAKSKRFFIVRHDGKLYAASAVCTHRGAPINAEGDKDFFCPRHKSYFSIEGTVTDGPAESSLPRYAISVNDQKHVIVDKSKSFNEAHWKDPASFIDLKPA